MRGQIDDLTGAVADGCDEARPHSGHAMVVPGSRVLQLRLGERVEAKGLSAGMRFVHRIRAGHTSVEHRTYAESHHDQEAHSSWKQPRPHH